MDQSYQKSLEQLEEILRTIQSDKCDIDQLSSLTKRAIELLTSCRKKLTGTEEEIKQILSNLEE